MILIEFFLFLLGAAFGSFLYVIASRYDPDKFLFTRNTLGGRSYCPQCKRTLRWYELIPLLSFLVQRGHCRECGARIGWSYFWVELCAGVLTALIPAYFAASFTPHTITLAALWTFVFLVLFLMTLIDMRLYMIPDEIIAILIAAALAIMAVSVPFWSAGAGTFWLHRLAAACAGALFFLAIIYLSKKAWHQDGMGFGDVKLIFALGLLFGSAQLLFLVIMAFVVGAVVGVIAIIARRKNMKSTIPFGPFLALASLGTFFFGPTLIAAYLRLLGFGS